MLHGIDNFFFDQLKFCRWTKKQDAQVCPAFHKANSMFPQ